MYITVLAVFVVIVGNNDDNYNNTNNMNAFRRNENFCLPNELYTATSLKTHIKRKLQSIERLLHIYIYIVYHIYRCDYLRLYRRNSLCSR